VTITLLYRHCNNWFRHQSRMLICMPYFQYLYSFFPKSFAEHLRICGGTQFENQTWESDLDNVDGSKKLKINPTWTKNSLRSNNKQNVLAYHLEDLRVPLVVRVPQVGNHCNSPKAQLHFWFERHHSTCNCPPIVCFKKMLNLVVT